MVNLGTGVGSSVNEVVAAWSAASGKPLPTQVAPRREGDVSEYCADVRFAKQLLGWETKFELAKMCEDHWRWQANNPKGYR